MKPPSVNHALEYLIQFCVVLTISLQFVLQIKRFIAGFFLAIDKLFVGVWLGLLDFFDFFLQRFDFLPDIWDIYGDHTNPQFLQSIIIDFLLHKGLF